METKILDMIYYLKRTRCLNYPVYCRFALIDENLNKSIINRNKSTISQLWVSVNFLSFSLFGNMIRNTS